MAVNVGSRAPDFTLPNQDREPVSLSGQSGRAVVLAFFPAAFTSVCTTEMCRFRDSLADLNAANAVVFGISTDHPASLKEFAAQQRLTFPLLSDYNHDVIAKYEVGHTDRSGFRGIAQRAVFVIDAEGMIRHREVTEHPGLEPNYDAVFEVLRELEKLGSG
jgi:glutaredoxin-dependent peroxiredoxin